MSLDRGSVNDLVDLDRYPIDGLADAEGRKLIETCHSALGSEGACQLPGFLSPSAIEMMTAEASALMPLAYRQGDTHNVYFTDVDASLPEDDPRRMLEHSSSLTVAWDQVPTGSGISRLYGSDLVLNFVAAALGEDTLYRHGDPFGACTVKGYAAGDELGWHFDNADFAVTLMLQGSEGGGSFEYVPWIRSDEDENHGGIADLLRGNASNVIRFPSEPGTLAFFRGQRSIHRVTPVSDDRLRINIVLAYANHPGVKLSENTQRLFYGRVA